MKFAPNKIAWTDSHSDACPYGRHPRACRSAPRYEWAMLKNELVLFYDEYPSDLLQPGRNKNAFFGTLISHKAIDENSMGGDEILRKFLEDPDLLSVSVCIEKTGILE